MYVGILGLVGLYVCYVMVDAWQEVRANERWKRELEEIKRRAGRGLE
jgi:hypothetical protein